MALVQAQEQLELIRQAETAAKELEEERALAESEAAATLAKAKKEAATIVQDAQANAAKIAQEQGQALNRLDKQLQNLMKTLNEQKAAAQQLEQVSTAASFLMTRQCFANVRQNIVNSEKQASQ